MQAEEEKNTFSQYKIENNVSKKADIHIYKMKRYLVLLFMAVVVAFNAMAQSSSMTDSQVMDFVLEQHNQGVSQSQIVTKLMQRGVNIDQIRRVRNNYERLMKDKGLGQVDVEGKQKVNTRMRKNNMADRQQLKDTKKNTLQNKTKNGQNQNNMLNGVDMTGQDYIDMQNEMNGLIPQDSLMYLPEPEKPEKKVFGRDIFNNDKLSFEPNMNIATPSNYRLGPGDAVFIEIYGASQKTIDDTVSPDGTVTIEGYGPIEISGLTVAEANRKLRSTLGARYSSSRIALTVGQTRTILVNVMGEVKVPGTYTLSAFATVFHALYMAGGISDIGTLRNIKVYRRGKLVSVVDIYDYILNGKLTGNVRLTDNDVIVVGPYDCLVNIAGKVKRPMYYEMKKNESVGTLLKYSGGFTGDAYTKAVRLIRKTGREYSVYNIGEFDMSSFHVADGDSVNVDSVIPRFENMAEIKGAVFRPGMYQVGGEINSVRSLIQHAEGLTEDAFTARAVMHRMKADRTLEVVPVDVEGIMSGKVADIPLKPNDVLFVPTKQNMMEDQTITIHGEVQYPGIYKYADNETLEDFVLQAGGLTDAASTMKVDVARRVNNPKALQADSVIARTYSFSLKDGFVIDGKPGFTLMPFDEVYVRKSPGYYKQQNVTIDGEVMFSGTYTLSRKNERLSDIIKACGGVNDRAYTKGARLERTRTPDEKRRMEEFLQMAQAKSGERDTLNIKKLDIGETYYVGIELDKAMAHPGSDYDITLREGDKIYVPQYNGTVKVSGDVMYPNTVAYAKGKSVSYYLDQAGGFSDRAKKSRTYIVYMNGTVARVGRNAKPMPGCEIIVPSKPVKDGRSLAQFLSIGTSMASITTMIATLANVLK